MKSPRNSKYLRKQAYRVPQTHYLDGISMNICVENSAHNFRVQSERELTLVVHVYIYIYIYIYIYVGNTLQNLKGSFFV